MTGHLFFSSDYKMESSLNLKFIHNFEDTNGLKFISIHDLSLLLGKLAYAGVPCTNTIYLSLCFVAWIEKSQSHLMAKILCTNRSQTYSRSLGLNSTVWLWIMMYILKIPCGMWKVLMFQFAFYFSVAICVPLSYQILYMFEPLTDFDMALNHSWALLLIEAGKWRPLQIQLKTLN